MECSQQRCTRGCGDAPGCSSRKVFPHRVRGGALAAARLWGLHVSAARGQLVPGSARGVCPLPPVQLSPPAWTCDALPGTVQNASFAVPSLARSLSVSLSQLSAAAVSVPSSLVFVPPLAPCRLRTRSRTPVEATGAQASDTLTGPGSSPARGSRCCHFRVWVGGHGLSTSGGLGHPDIF